MSHGKKAPIDQNLPREKEYEGKSTKAKKPKNGKILKCKEIIKKYKRKKTVIKIKKNTPIRKKECKKHREKSTKGRGNKIVIQKINLNQTKRQSKNPNSVRKTSNRQAAMVNKNKRRLIMAGKISRDNHFRRGNRPADVTTSLSNKTTNQRQSIDKLDVTETNYRGGRIPMWYKSTNTRRIVSSIKTFMRTTSLNINLLMRNTKSLNRKYSEKIKIIKLYKVYKYFFNDSKESKIKINKEKEPKPENTAKGDGKESDSNNNITPEEKNTQSEENEENIFSTPSSSSHIPENGKNAEQTLQINEQSIAQNTNDANQSEIATASKWNPQKQALILRNLIGGDKLNAGLVAAKELKEADTQEKPQKHKINWWKIDGKIKTEETNNTYNMCTYETDEKRDTYNMWTHKAGKTNDTYNMCTHKRNETCNETQRAEEAKTNMRPPRWNTESHNIKWDTNKVYPSETNNTYNMWTHKTPLMWNNETKDSNKNQKDCVNLHIKAPNKYLKNQEDCKMHDDADNPSSVNLHNKAPNKYLKKPG